MKDFETNFLIVSWIIQRACIITLQILETSRVLILPKSEIEWREERWILNYIVIKLFVKFRIPIIIMLLEDIYRDERVDVDVHEGDGKKVIGRG